MRDRLDVMHDVARYKWAKKAPVEDAGREAASLREVANRGKGLGLAPETTREFFAAQIEAAKLIQRADFRRWEADRRGPGGEPPDLVHVLRPRIDALNRELLAALAKNQALPGDAGSSTTRIRSRAEILLTGEGIDAEVRAAAIRPLVRAGEGRVTLDQVP
jgi:chorismate mutase